MHFLVPRGRRLGFDDQIYMVTSTREATATLLAERRVQEALMRLVGTTGSVEVEDGTIRVQQSDAPESLDEARAETIALLAHI